MEQMEEEPAEAVPQPETSLHGNRDAVACGFGYDPCFLLLLPHLRRSGKKTTLFADGYKCAGKSI